MMKGQKGITLVALIITIIVMLILVGVSITIAMNGGLFDTARSAATNTNTAAKAEQNLANGSIDYRVDSDDSGKNYIIYHTTADAIANGSYNTAASTTYINDVAQQH